MRARARLRKLCCRELEWWERLSESFTDLLDVTIIGLVLLTKETPIYYKIGTRNSKHSFDGPFQLQFGRGTILSWVRLPLTSTASADAATSTRLTSRGVTCQNRRSRRHRHCWPVLNPLIRAPQHAKFTVVWAFPLAFSKERSVRHGLSRAHSFHVPLTLQSTCTVTNETIHPNPKKQSVPRSTARDDNTCQKLRITEQYTNSKGAKVWSSQVSSTYGITPPPEEVGRYFCILYLQS